MSIDLEKENMILRKLLWLLHGHDRQYGDDGEMQCEQCFKEYGFWDWKRTPATEIQERIERAQYKKLDELLKEFEWKKAQK